MKTVDVNMDMIWLLIFGVSNYETMLYFDRDILFSGSMK